MVNVAVSVGATIVTGTSIVPPWDTVIVGLPRETERTTGAGVELLPPQPIKASAKTTNMAPSVLLNDGNMHLSAVCSCKLKMPD